LKCTMKIGRDEIMQDTKATPQDNKGAAPQAELPEGWVWTTVEDCVEILDSVREPINATERKERIAGKSESELIPYYGATGQVGYIDDYLFDEELVLLGEDGAPFLDPFKYKAYVIKGKSWVNNHAHVLRAIPGLMENKYLCHYLNIIDYHDYITGTTRYKLNQRSMKIIPILLPPLNEQHRIVTKIEQLFTKLDAGVKELKTAKAQLQRYRRSVLKHAFEGKLTAEWREAHRDELEPVTDILEKAGRERIKDIPKSVKILPFEKSELPNVPKEWVWTSAMNVCKWITNGYTPKAHKMFRGKGEIPFIKVYNITQNGTLDFSIKPTFIGKETHTTELKRSIVYPGDVLMNIVGPPLGKVCIVPDFYPEWNMNQAIVFYKPMSLLDRRFLLYSLRSESILRWAVKRAKATAGQYNLTITISRSLPIPLPHILEQQMIVKEIGNRLSIADQIEKSINQSLKQSKRLRQSILKRAFEGKLVPQDPDDEPAEKLLEKIRAAKKQNKAPRPAKAGGKSKRNRRPEQKRLNRHDN